MKKIGIITLGGKHNYGNRLQNYALQTALTNIGADAITLTEPVKFSFAKGIKAALKPILRYTPLYKNRLQYVMRRLKYRSFKAFDDDNVREHALDDSPYDLLISGSDQVWNPKFAGRDFHFLTFAPPEKRFSYAASLGVSEIPEEQKTRYAKHLRNFNKISVREDDGKKIVEELTGRKDVVVVPDPTMLLTRNDWDNLTADAKPKDAPTGKYIVIYALHNLAEENRANVLEYARAKGYEIYQIMGDLYDRSYKIPDPREFVWLIAHAEAVFTDSFHCCVFSIIYHRPFIVFERTDGQKMSSRLSTLTKRFEIQKAMYQRGQEIDEILNGQTFEHVDRIALKHRDAGLRFLESIVI